jgi:hypothetical protein
LLLHLLQQLQSAYQQPLLLLLLLLLQARCQLLQPLMHLCSRLPLHRRCCCYAVLRAC